MLDCQIPAHAWVVEQTAEIEIQAAGEDLFDRSLLLDLDISMGPVQFNPELSVARPGDGLMVRPLNSSDFDRGFLELLGQLTTVGEVSRQMWEQRFARMREREGTYLVTVIEDTDTERVR